MASYNEGDKLKAIFWNNGECKVGVNGVEKIEVIMESGQMGNVPWFGVWVGGRIKTKYNGALVEGVELLEANDGEGG